MENTKKQIHFILTDGTIDSHYDGTKDAAVPNENSVIPRFIEGLELYIQTTFTQVYMKNSRDLNLDDMKAIKEIIEKSDSNHFIITHGTYWYLKQNLKNKKATIVFTGSMIPLESFADSGTPFNIGFSTVEIFHLAPGIYACINGKIFDPNVIAKLTSQGRLVSIFGEWKLKLKDFRIKTELGAPFMGTPILTI